MLRIDLDYIRLLLLLLGVDKTCGRVFETLSELGLSYCSLEKFHFIFEEFDFNLTHITLSPQLIQLLHNHWHHQLPQL